MHEMKRCPACGETKPASAFSMHRKRGKEYLRSRCRDCLSAEGKAVRALDPTRKHYERVRFDAPLGVEVKRCLSCLREKPTTEFSPAEGKPRARCRECARGAARAAYRANPEIARAKQKAYAERHPERVRARHASYRQAHPDRNRRRYRANPERFRSIRRRRTALVRTVTVAPVDRAEIIARDRATCYLCGEVLPDHRITLDHVVPLSRGGVHGPENVRVCCMPCNLRKGARLLA